MISILAIAEEIAGEGFIVVCVWHTDGSAPINVESDGRIHPDHKYIRLRQGASFVSEETYMFRNYQLKQRVLDVRSTLSFIKQLNANSSDIFAGKLDLSKVMQIHHTL
jgi:hypothetical protein